MQANRTATDLSIFFFAEFFKKKYWRGPDQYRKFRRRVKSAAQIQQVRLCTRPPSPMGLEVLLRVKSPQRADASKPIVVKLLDKKNCVISKGTHALGWRQPLGASVWQGECVALLLGYTCLKQIQSRLKF
jgi:hypothetical protein